MEENIREVQEPGRILSYFKLEKWTLALITCSGIFYNVGMTAGPWFEGKLAQCLYGIIAGEKDFRAMAVLAACYVAVIFAVQAMRFVKRLYVRKFANHINRDMKHVLYRSLVHKSKAELETEQTGAIMTKAISDVDTCVEGMRKFTTEVFDTGVVMVSYLVMLLWYDWRLTLISMLFPPLAYVIAERLKKKVSAGAAAYKESAGRLNGVALDRVQNALTYRVYGQEENQDAEYETYLSDYEHKAVRANIWETAMQPLYQIISMAGVPLILWFGAKNVMGEGWTPWDIAAFTTFLSCFAKLAAKSSKAAKLFNAVQKAHVSWKRICPLLKDAPEADAASEKEHMFAKGETVQPGELVVEHLSFAYPSRDEASAADIFTDVSFSASPGEIIGVTGAVACGKSTFGRTFLCEYPYRGTIRFAGKELSERMAAREKIVSYMGHQPELLNDTIWENILLGDEGDVEKYLRAVCLDRETAEMPDGMLTKIGSGGIRLSGGQQARIALARALCHKAPILVLDDPFSAVDAKTEQEIMEHLRVMAQDSIVIFLSHRLTQFPELSKVLWMENGQITVSDHAHLMQEKQAYASLYRMQTGADKQQRRNGE